MELPSVVLVIQWFGGLTAFATLGTILLGIRRGVQHPAGPATGYTAAWLRSPVFYLVATTLFLIGSITLWRNLPIELSSQEIQGITVIGALVYFPSMLFILWGRLALGKMYFVSTSFAAPLFADHQLVTHGPYTIVRHPMYLGIMMAAFGSLLIYQTWTTAVFVLFAPFLLLRARREEQTLAAEFGEQWKAYCQRVPAIIPGSRSRIIHKINP